MLGIRPNGGALAEDAWNDSRASLDREMEPLGLRMPPKGSGDDVYPENIVGGQPVESPPPNGSQPGQPVDEPTAPPFVEPVVGEPQKDPGLIGAILAYLKASLGLK